MDLCSLQKFLRNARAYFGSKKFRKKSGSPGSGISLTARISRVTVDRAVDPALDLLIDSYGLEFQKCCRCTDERKERGDRISRPKPYDAYVVSDRDRRLYVITVEHPDHQRHCLAVTDVKFHSVALMRIRAVSARYESTLKEVPSELFRRRQYIGTLIRKAHREAADELLHRLRCNGDLDRGTELPDIRLELQEREKVQHIFRDVRCNFYGSCKIKPLVRLIRAEYPREECLPLGKALRDLVHEFLTEVFAETVRHIS